MEKNYNGKVELTSSGILNCTYNSVLKSKREYCAALDQINQLGFPIHGDLPKNWDSLAAWSIIKYESELNKGIHKKHMRILDAGGEYYSVILHHLAAYGFKGLYSMNTSFNEASQTGGIKYVPGDITKTEFNDQFFDFVTCLSVLEHGVNINQYFKEMSRIIKPNGLLIISTDYWATPIDNLNKVAYGVPIKIFCEQEILNIIQVAGQNGLSLIVPIDLGVKNRVIRWKGLKYTFIYFSFRKDI